MLPAPSQRTVCQPPLFGMILPTVPTATEKPEPEPPRFAFEADSVSVDRKKRPRLVMVTEVTALPETTIVAAALFPEPPVSGTFV